MSIHHLARTEHDAACRQDVLVALLPTSVFVKLHRESFDNGARMGGVARSPPPVCKCVIMRCRATHQVRLSLETQLH
jgi:hypothetical protein